MANTKRSLLLISNCFLEQHSTQERSHFWFARKTIKCHSEISTLAKLTHVSLLLRMWYLVSAASSGGRHDIIVTHVSMKYVPKDDWVLFGSHSPGQISFLWISKRTLKSFFEIDLLQCFGEIDARTNIWNISPSQEWQVIWKSHQSYLECEPCWSWSFFWVMTSNDLFWLCRM